MSYLNRGIRFFLFHLTRNPAFLVVYSLNFFNPNYVPRIKYHELTELENLLRQGKSLIRLGDGEIYIMNGGGIGYQKYDQHLSVTLQRMVSGYADSANYVLGLAELPLSKSNRQLRQDNLLHCWLPTKVYWQLYFNKKATYFDAHFFYYPGHIAKYLESYLKTKQLIIATNRQNIDRLKNNQTFPFTAVTFIETPEAEAMSVYAEIKELVLVVANKIGIKEVVVLAALGPASKVLAYELSQLGVQTLDIGRGIEATYTAERLEQAIYPGL